MAAAASKTKACIFCPNPRTRKRGEHVWDDWLNREGGKEIRRRSTITESGAGGVVIRAYPTDSLDVTRDVVCDHCNNTWMSDVSSHAKDKLQFFIRHGRAGTLDEIGIVTVVAFAFLKSAVLDWSVGGDGRTRCISRSVCTQFRRSLTSPFSDAVTLPDGMQVWIAHYRREREMEAYALIDELEGAGPFKGYRILVLTYVVGAFAFQATFPRWMKRTRKHAPMPSFLQSIRDRKSVPIWPNVSIAHWPPLAHVSRATLEDFRQRFRRVLVPRIVS